MNPNLGTYSIFSEAVQEVKLDLALFLHRLQPQELYLAGIGEKSFYPSVLEAVTSWGYNVTIFEDLTAGIDHDTVRKEMIAKGVHYTTTRAFMKEHFDIVGALTDEKTLRKMIWKSASLF